MVFKAVFYLVPISREYTRLYIYYNGLRTREVTSATEFVRNSQQNPPQTIVVLKNTFDFNLALLAFNSWDKSKWRTPMMAIIVVYI